MISLTALRYTFPRPQTSYAGHLTTAMMPARESYAFCGQSCYMFLASLPARLASTLHAPEGLDTFPESSKKRAAIRRQQRDVFDIVRLDAAQLHGAGDSFDRYDVRR